MILFYPLKKTSLAISKMDFFSSKTIIKDFNTKNIIEE